MLSVTASTSRVFLRPLALTALCVIAGCRASVRVVPGPPEVIIGLTQRPGADPGCAVSVPEQPTVITRQPFAFANQTDSDITVVQNEANIHFATIPPGGTSSAMILKSAQSYAYFTFAPRVRIVPGHPCRLNVLQVVDRKP
jgi:hypothetical protein